VGHIVGNKIVYIGGSIVGIKIKAELDGVEETFEVLSDFDERLHTHAITGSGTVVSKDIPHTENVRLRLVRKRHDHGGVIFEETGETRPLRGGDWFWNGSVPLAASLWHIDIGYKQTIIRHVCGNE
jgi:hypothetical protein